MFEPDEDVMPPAAKLLQQTKKAANSAILKSRGNTVLCIE